MCKAMKFVTSISSNIVGIFPEYVYVESPEIAKEVYAISIVKSGSSCDYCPKNPAVNEFVSDFCSCTLNLPDSYFYKTQKMKNEKNN